MQPLWHIDSNDAGSIVGWALDKDNPHVPLSLELLSGTHVVARTVADTARLDLKAAGIGTGAHGFHLAVPFVPKSEPLSLRVAGTDTYLLKAEPRDQTSTRSRFGGLWIDRADFADEFACRRRDGRLGAALAAKIEAFARDGYLVIPGAVSHRKVDALNAEIEKFWDDPPFGLLIETWEPDRKLKLIAADKQYRDGTTKLLDLYAFSARARDAIAAPAVVEFLSAIFDDKPKAFQGLYFHKGSEQDIHKDTAYVKVDSGPMNLAATWLALEDVKAGTGELVYYLGSHRAPEYLFSGYSKWAETNSSEVGTFLDSLDADAARYGQRQEAFLARKGDVLIWHADLAHGGAPIQHPGATRMSLVTHFTTAADEPYYRRASHHEQLERRDCNFVSSHAPIQLQRYSRFSLYDWYRRWRHPERRVP